MIYEMLRYISEDTLRFKVRKIQRTNVGDVEDDEAVSNAYMDETIQRTQRVSLCYNCQNPFKQKKLIRLKQNSKKI